MCGSVQKNRYLFVLGPTSPGKNETTTSVERRPTSPLFSQAFLAVVHVIDILYFTHVYAYHQKDLHRAAMVLRNKQVVAPLNMATAAKEGANSRYGQWRVPSHILCSFQRLRLSLAWNARPSRADLYCNLRVHQLKKYSHHLSGRFLALRTTQHSALFSNRRGVRGARSELVWNLVWNRP